MPMIETLQRAMPGRVSVAASDLETHGRDENYPESRPPLAVVYARSLEDVREALAWARATHMPVIPFGAGTSLEGHLVPVGDSISLDLSQMNTVHAVRPADFLAEVGPGLTRVGLNAALKHTGLFFPVDPGADASLGGMAATNASGTTTVRYGGMRQNVAALEVVLASGEVLALGRPVRKTSSSYDLKDLFIGSGGTLGIITRLTLHLHPLPEYVHTLRVFFPSLSAAAEAAYGIMASALPVARLELIDRLGLRAINQFLQRTYPEQPALFIEFHSSTAEAIAAESRAAMAIVKDSGAEEIAVATTEEERIAQWEARHRLYWAARGLHPTYHHTVTDTAVPLSAIPEMVSYMEQLLDELALEGGIVGHIGDGNVHALVSTPPERDVRALEFSARVVERALALGGTASGEHGIGLTKRKFLEAEHGAAVPWLRQIKALFDPDTLLNPGKVV
jgi:D-lactate dehydrogenase (cytochrome)